MRNITRVVLSMAILTVLVVPFGVLTLVLGMVSTAVFSLLSAFTVFTSVSVLGVALGVGLATKRVDESRRVVGLLRDPRQAASGADVMWVGGGGGAKLFDGRGVLCSFHHLRETRTMCGCDQRILRRLGDERIHFFQ